MKPTEKQHVWATPRCSARSIWSATCFIALLTLTGCGSRVQGTDKIANETEEQATTSNPVVIESDTELPATSITDTSEPVNSTDTTTTDETNISSPLEIEEPTEVVAVTVDELNALELIQQHPQLGELSQLITSSSVSDLFTDENQQLTLFAPNDTAFAQYSQAQRARLSNDADRIEDMLNLHIVKDVSLSEATFGAITSASLAWRETIQIVPVDDSVKIIFSNDFELLVAETIAAGDVIIHLVDDFFPIPFGIFDPDPDTLGANVASLDPGVALALERSKWQSILGNEERYFTVMAPVSDSLEKTDGPIRLVDHIIEHDFAPDDGLAPGNYQAVSGAEILVEQEQTWQTVNDQDVLVVSQHAARNGQVHLLRRPIIQPGVDVTNAPGRNLLTALDALDNYPTGFNAKGLDSVNTLVSMGIPFSRSPPMGARLLAALIRETGQESVYEDPTARMSVLIPLHPSDLGLVVIGTAACTTYQVYESVINRYARFVDGTTESLIPTVFPDVLSAAGFLAAHTLVGAHSESLLNQSTGSELVNSLGTSFVLSEQPVYATDTNGDSYVLRTNFRLGNSSYRHMASVANGSVLRVGPEIVQGAEPELDPGDVCDQYGNPVASNASTLLHAGLEDYAERFEQRIRLARLNDANTQWTVFAPTDTALATQDTNVHSLLIEHSVVVSNSLSPEEIVSSGQVTTSRGKTYPVTQSADGGITVGGFPVTLISVDPSLSQIYKIEGVLN